MRAQRCAPRCEHTCMDVSSADQRDSEVGVSGGMQRNTDEWAAFVSEDRSVRLQGRSGGGGASAKARQKKALPGRLRKKLARDRGAA